MLSFPIGLRTKLILTILGINAIAGIVLFFHLTHVQVEEERVRIDERAHLFAEYTTDRLINDFSSYFTQDYEGKFLPRIQQAHSANENLKELRIINRTTKKVLFASNHSLGENEELSIDEVTEDTLRERGVYSRASGTQLTVLREPVSELSPSKYWVEFQFHYDTLDSYRSRMQLQIFRDLLPATLFGVMIAVLFAHLWIAPVHKVVSSLRSVAQGDYAVSVASDRRDELGEVGRAFNQMTEELRRKTELKKYLSDSTYREVMNAAEPIQGTPVVPARKRQAAILFTDIRNFVGWCDRLTPDGITQMLNSYFAEMVQVVVRHSGEVDKFIGDALLAVFYADEGETENSPESAVFRAVSAAVEMRTRLAALNIDRARNNQDPLETGVGISFGEVIFGPIGAPDRMDFTVIGDVVNTASRIEKLARDGKYSRIMLTEEVVAAMNAQLQTVVTIETVGEDVAIKGKTEKIKVYEVVSWKQPDSVVESFVEQALREKEERATVSLLRSIAELSPTPALDRLVVLFEHPSERVRSSVIETLSVGRRIELFDRAVSPHEHHRVRIAGALALIKHGEVERGLNVLDQMMSGGNSGVSPDGSLSLASAVYALGVLSERWPDWSHQLKSEVVQVESHERLRLFFRKQYFNLLRGLHSPEESIRNQSARTVSKLRSHAHWLEWAA